MSSQTAQISCFESSQAYSHVYNFNVRDLIRELGRLIPPEEKEDFLKAIRAIQQVSPCPVFANMQMWLIQKGRLTFDDALKLQAKFGNTNKCLYEMPETSFGIRWGQKYIQKMDERFCPAPLGFDHHDLVLESIKVEVKATRAVRKAKGPLSHRALPSDTTEAFQMNFNHIFLDEADCYVMIVVWSDTIWHWVIPKTAIPPFLHKYQNEFQMPVTRKTIEGIKQYRCDATEVPDRILAVRETLKIGRLHN